MNSPAIQLLSIISFPSIELFITDHSDHSGKELLTTLEQELKGVGYLGRNK